ncbi:MAG: HAD family hydrolase [Planctomycetes bacterium]|nr:HAD family hydrolase [Planctomycetota bacterium]
MSTIQAVVFDLDDTLYPERAFAFSGFDAVVERFGQRLGWGPPEAARMRMLFDSEQRATAFNAMLEESAVEPETHATLIAEMVAAYRQHSPRIALHADADRALARLHGRYRLGIVSDGILGTQQAKIDALGLAARVDHVVLTDQWGRDHWKPDPKGFAHLAAELCVPHTSCIYVADNPAKDFIAPNRLGWRTVQIRRSDGIYAGLVAPSGGKPHATIDTLDDVDACLLG